MKVLVLNCGSSSLKFQLIETDEQKIARDEDVALARGIVDNIGSEAVLKVDLPSRGTTLRETAEVLDHKAAVSRALELLTRPEAGVLADPAEIGAVGHRVVHGGERFHASVLIDDEVLRAIESCFDIAPLHNPPNVKGYRAAREALPAAPQAAVFDTSFHQTLAPEAYLYGLPYVLYERHGIRRYGFHGTSHRYVSARLARHVGREGDPALRVVTCHLGNGCSITAIRGGRSVDTSMGFTPLEGLLMGTRSGDLDAAAALHVMRKEELGEREAQALLNKHSGLLGLSGVSNDMRALLEAEAQGNPRAKLAIDVFCYRLRKYVGAYAAALGGLDALAFAGGIGENAAAIRERALHGLEGLGLRVDPERNAAANGVEARISPEGAPVAVAVIPTNEELLIARDAYRLVAGLPLA
ncbi:MAG: acetate kinase [Vicinamibacteria bacterium]|jgi:acetate kinase|nr:acetate kinase [Vicinamibacteria bacterium]